MSLLRNRVAYFVFCPSGTPEIAVITYFADRHSKAIIVKSLVVLLVKRNLAIVQLVNTLIFCGKFVKHEIRVFTRRTCLN